MTTTNVMIHTDPDTPIKCARKQIGARPYFVLDIGTHTVFLGETELLALHLEIEYYAECVRLALPLEL